MKNIIGMAMVVGIVSLNGCANLTVHKIVANEKGTVKDDCTKGFRYYLSRPYVVVKEPICVSEQISLITLSSSDLNSDDKLHQAAFASIGSNNADNMSPEELSKRTAAVIAQIKEITRVSDAASAALVNPPSAQSPAPMTVQINPAAAEDAAGANDTAENDTASNNTTTTEKVQAAELQLDETKTVDLKSAIQVVFLPDMDEQYAVHNPNFLGQSSYKLAFKDGWQLQGVSADCDNTAVAIALLKAVQAGIESAKKIALQRNALAQSMKNATPASNAAAAAFVDKSSKEKRIILEVVTCTYLKPGMYRINKPWEMENGASCVGGEGFLSHLGIATHQTTEVRPASAVTLTQAGHNLPSSDCCPAKSPENGG